MSSPHAVDQDDQAFAPRPEWTKHWSQFRAVMERRFAAGHEQYGDGVFSRNRLKTADEIAQETLDIVGWGFILWVRCENLKAAIAKADAAEPIDDVARRIWKEIEQAFSWGDGATDAYRNLKEALRKEREREA